MFVLKKGQIIKKYENDVLIRLLLTSDVEENDEYVYGFILDNKNDIVKTHKIVKVDNDVIIKENKFIDEFIINRLIANAKEQDLKFKTYKRIKK